MDESVYTLVLALDKTMTYMNESKSVILIRPGARELIKELSKYYELVLFTTSEKEYVDNVMKLIDPEGIIKHKFNKQYAVYVKGTYAKDIRKLGRDVKRILMIDSNIKNYQYLPQNGIYISQWKGDDNDKELLNLIPLLKEVVTQKVVDVRTGLRNFRDINLRNMMTSYKTE